MLDFKRASRSHKRADPWELDDELKCEECCEDKVHNVKELCVQVRLVVEAHGQKQGVYQDGSKHKVLKEWACYKRPYPILKKGVISYKKNYYYSLFWVYLVKRFLIKNFYYKILPWVKS